MKTNKEEPSCAGCGTPIHPNMACEESSTQEEIAAYRALTPKNQHTASLTPHKEKTAVKPHLVTLTLTTKQADIVQEALDLYARIGLGQIDQIDDCLPPINTTPEVGAGYYMHLTDLLAEAVRKMESGTNRDYNVMRRYYDLGQSLATGMHHNASFGVNSTHSNKNADIAFDIRDVIRHYRSWSRYPEGGMGVSFDKPMHWGSEPLPTIKEKK